MGNKNKNRVYLFLRILILILLLSIIYYLSFIYLEYDCESIFFIKEIFDFNINFSFMLFGVIGVWISIVYSDSLKLIITGNKQQINDIHQNIDYLINPFIYSIISLLISFIFYFSKNILKEYLFYNKISFFIVSSLFIGHFYFLFMIFKPFFILRTEALNKKYENEIDDDLFPR